MTIETQSKVRAWGNSLGLTIPKEEAEKEKLTEGDVVEVKITKKRNLKDLFGALKGSKIDSQKMKDESRKMWGMT